jgi:hypothetical protein
MVIPYRQPPATTHIVPLSADSLTSRVCPPPLSLTRFDKSLEVQVGKLLACLQQETRSASHPYALGGSCRYFSVSTQGLPWGRPLPATSVKVIWRLPHRTPILLTHARTHSPASAPPSRCARHRMCLPSLQRQGLLVLRRLRRPCVRAWWTPCCGASTRARPICGQHSMRGGLRSSATSTRAADRTFWSPSLLPVTTSWGLLYCNCWPTSRRRSLRRKLEHSPRQVAQRRSAD